jgi:hypothetical protein
MTDHTDATRRRERQPYERPTLQSFGALSRLTAAGSAGQMEDGMMMVGPTFIRP